MTTAHNRAVLTDAQERADAATLSRVPENDWVGLDDDSTGAYAREERGALRRVAGLSTELTDITEVEYRQLRLERVVLVGVWTEGTVADADRSLA
jgi:GTP-binding protein HflX